VARRAELLFRYGYQSQLEALYQEDFIQPESRRNEVLSLSGRDCKTFRFGTGDWGFPVPVNQNHTLYVWFDALLGYVTALSDSEPLENALAKWWPINLPW